ncbi:MAG TPA: serine hydrolase domain-containing protein [Gemmatimonadales bacterium]|nr:serine hydrolase domain-containing protein [Gemmatimonadales bacterium]
MRPHLFAGRALATLAGAALFALPLAAQQPAASAPPRPRAALAAQLDSLARAAVASGRAASVSVAVLRGADTLLLRAYGRADLEQEVAATPAAVYRIGSTTKQFTAAAILQQVEQGRLALDDDLTKYLPAYPTGGRRVTIAELLDHTSGIADYTSLGDRFGVLATRDVPQDTLVALFAAAPFTFEPGTKWSYSNSGYYLLGIILERVTGEAWADYLARHVFPRAGLAQTRYCDDASLVPHRVRGYQLVGTQFVNADPISMSIPYAAGALCSTPRELVRWMRALREGKVVSAASYRRMITAEGAARTPSPGDTSMHYGFGLFTRAIHGHRAVEHGGAINGFGSFLADFPDDSVTIAVLANTAGPVAGALGVQLAGAVFGAPVKPWAPMPPAAAPAAEVALTPAERARYVGVYRLRPAGDALRASRMELTYHVYEENGRLMGWAPGEAPDRLVAEGDGVFHAALAPTARITFVTDGAAAGAPVRRISIVAGGSMLSGERVVGTER